MKSERQNPADGLIDRAGKAGREVMAHEGLRGRGEHYRLSRAEVEVFRIDPSLALELNGALTRFEGMIGVVEGMWEGFDERAKKDRAEHKEYVSEWDEERPVFNHLEAAKFMNEVCGFPYDQCWAWVWKQEFVFWREGLVELPQEKASEDYRERMRLARDGC